MSNQTDQEDREMDELIACCIEMCSPNWPGAQRVAREDTVHCEAISSTASIIIDAANLSRSGQKVIDTISAALADLGGAQRVYDVVSRMSCAHAHEALGLHCEHLGHNFGVQSLAYDHMTSDQRAADYVAVTRELDVIAPV